MKLKNAENNKVLENSVINSVILEAPTVPELEKKIRQYKLLLVKTIVNTHRLSELIMDGGEVIYVTPTGSYQAVLHIQFRGHKKTQYTNPEQTLKCLKKLTALQSTKKQTSHHCISSMLSIQDVLQYKQFPLEVDSEDDIELAIDNKKSQILQQLIEGAYITHVTFSDYGRRKDQITGKTIIPLSAKYEYRKFLDSVDKKSPIKPEEPEGK